MIKFTKNIFLFFGILSGVNALAQSTTNSPYSRFALGELTGTSLPQTRALGGIGAALRKPTGYNNINLSNPASYSAITLTAFDIGLYSSFNSLTKDGRTEKNFTGSLSHVVFAIPVSRYSGLSFGVLPFSTMGYRNRQAVKADTITVNHIYNGDGGLSKAYLGYAYQIGQHLSIGGNISYIFGKLEQNRDAEFPYDAAALNTRNQVIRSVGGLSFEYGLQYFTKVNKRVKLTLGYSGSASNKLNSSLTNVSTHYTKDATGNENIALDSTVFKDNISSNLKLPLSHRMGVVFERADRWLIGADVTMAQWSDYREGNSNPGLRNAFGIAVGGQITPDITAVGSYFKLVDYRLGFKYDKTYIALNNSDINQAAITLGLGLPLPSTRSTFYKINIGAELGQRGKLDNSLVRERFANIYLGFTINDKWFQRYKFD